MEEDTGQGAPCGDQVATPTRTAASPASKASTPNATSPNKLVYLPRSLSSTPGASVLTPIHLGHLLAASSPSSSSSSPSLRSRHNVDTANITASAPPPPADNTGTDATAAQHTPHDDSRITPDQQLLMSPKASSNLLASTTSSDNAYDSTPSGADPWMMASLAALATEAAAAVIITPGSSVAKLASHSTSRQQEAASAARQLLLGDDDSSPSTEGIIRCFISNIIRRVISANIPATPAEGNTADTTSSSHSVLLSSLFSTHATLLPAGSINSTSSLLAQLSSSAASLAADAQEEVALSTSSQRSIISRPSAASAEQHKDPTAALGPASSITNGSEQEASQGQPQQGLDFLSTSAGTSISFSVEVPASEQVPSAYTNISDITTFAPQSHNSLTRASSAPSPTITTSVTTRSLPSTPRNATRDISSGNLSTSITSDGILQHDITATGRTSQQPTTQAASADISAPDSPITTQPTSAAVPRQMTEDDFQGSTSGASTPIVLKTAAAAAGAPAAAGMMTVRAMCWPESPLEATYSLDWCDGDDGDDGEETPEWLGSSSSMSKKASPEQLAVWASLTAAVAPADDDLSLMAAALEPKLSAAAVKAAIEAAMPEVEIRADEEEPAAAAVPAAPASQVQADDEEDADSSQGFHAAVAAVFSRLVAAAGADSTAQLPEQPEPAAEAMEAAVPGNTQHASACAAQGISIEAEAAAPAKADASAAQQGACDPVVMAAVEAIFTRVLASAPQDAPPAAAAVPAAMASAAQQEDAHEQGQRLSRDLYSPFKISLEGDEQYYDIEVEVMLLPRAGAAASPAAPSTDAASPAGGQEAGGQAAPGGMAAEEPAALADIHAAVANLQAGLAAVHAELAAAEELAAELSVPKSADTSIAKSSISDAAPPAPHTASYVDGGRILAHSTESDAVAAGAAAKPQQVSINAGQQASAAIDVAETSTQAAMPAEHVRLPAPQLASPLAPLMMPKVTISEIEPASDADISPVPKPAYHSAAQFAAVATPAIPIFSSTYLQPPSGDEPAAAVSGGCCATADPPTEAVSAPVASFGKDDPLHTADSSTSVVQTLSPAAAAGDEGDEGGDAEDQAMLDALIFLRQMIYRLAGEEPPPLPAAGELVAAASTATPEEGSWADQVQLEAEAEAAAQRPPLLMQDSRAAKKAAKAAARAVAKAAAAEADDTEEAKEPVGPPARLPNLRHPLFARHWRSVVKVPKEEEASEPVLQLVQLLLVSDSSGSIAVELKVLQPAVHSGVCVKDRGASSLASSTNTASVAQQQAEQQAAVNTADAGASNQVAQDEGTSIDDQDITSLDPGAAEEEQEAEEIISKQPLLLVPCRSRWAVVAVPAEVAGWVVGLALGSLDVLLIVFLALLVTVLNVSVWFAVEVLGGLLP